MPLLIECSDIIFVFATRFRYCLLLGISCQEMMVRQVCVLTEVILWKSL